ncbi:hypothetical protein ACFQZS_07480 [Mucilaginibacter calamicampi]|uniref:Uncharacterized protein n=1 Tax=Mucilaginibacter calamicampi TaxID=1302352 RepID=A0ABW2YU56_9SPHI
MSLTDGDQNENSFKKFKAKFKLLSLPLSINTLEIDVSKQRKLTGEDNIFVKSEYPNELYAYGMLTDTTGTYKLIWLEPAEIHVPVLATFTKTGKFIKKEYMSVGQCGSDCGFECTEFIQIKTDLTIFSADSIKSSACDSMGNIKETSTQKYTLFKKGKISKNGRIDFTSVNKKIH